MKTKYSGAMLIWLVTALILTACGGGGATNSNQTTNTAPVANAGTAQNVTPERWSRSTAVLAQMRTVILLPIAGH